MYSDMEKILGEIYRLDTLKILEHEELLNVEQHLMNSLHFDSNYHGINWAEYPERTTLSESGNLEESKLKIEQFIKEVNTIDCYVMWDRGDLPIVTINLAILLENLALITRIAFDTWIVGVDSELLIEFHHSGVYKLTLST
jgi:hypothetical protein